MASSCRPASGRFWRGCLRHPGALHLHGHVLVFAQIVGRGHRRADGLIELDAYPQLLNREMSRLPAAWPTSSRWKCWNAGPVLVFHASAAAEARLQATQRRACPLEERMQPLEPAQCFPGSVHRTQWGSTSHPQALAQVPRVPEAPRLDQEYPVRQPRAVTFKAVAPSGVRRKRNPHSQVEIGVHHVHRQTRV